MTMAFRPAARARSVVLPAACSSLIVGVRSAAREATRHSKSNIMRIGQNANTGLPESDLEGQFKIPWSTQTSGSPTIIDAENAPRVIRDEGLIQAIVRAHSWLLQLNDGIHDSVEELAKANRIHPRAARQALRLAFLSPEITSSILEGKQPPTLSLARIPKLLPLSRATQQHLLA